jgi:hypothetical protein
MKFKRNSTPFLEVLNGGSGGRSRPNRDDPQMMVDLGEKVKMITNTPFPATHGSIAIANN